MKLDAVDTKIVRLLQGNARLTHEQIGREVHLSRPAVHERVRRLEQAGVLRGYSAQVDWEAVGLPLTAFVWVRVASACLPIGRGILELTSETAVVEDCHRVAGEWCLLVKTRSASSVALQDLLDRIMALPGVQTTMTTVVLSTLGEARTGGLPAGNAPSTHTEEAVSPSASRNGVPNGREIPAGASERRPG